MLTFRQYIEEAFDKPYPYKMKYDKAYEYYEATAVLDNGDDLTITFDKLEPIDDTSGDEWQVEFLRNESIEVTGEGDQMRIFATVIDAIKKFIKKESPKKIIFTAIKIRDNKKNSPSREKLYSRLVKRFAGQLGYSSKEESKSRVTNYILTKK